MIRMNNLTKITQHHYKIKTRGKRGGENNSILCHKIHAYCIFTLEIMKIELGSLQEMFLLVFPGGIEKD